LTTEPPTNFAVIITHNRPELLRRCVDAIAPQVDTVLVIDNASDPPVMPSDYHADSLTFGKVLQLDVPTQPPNLPALWNLGLGVVANIRMATENQQQADLLRGTAAIRTQDSGSAHVAFLCDDAIAPAGWFDAVTTAMDRTGAAAGCSDPFGHLHEPILKTQQDSDLLHRMVGWAFVLDADRGIEPDETMHWWWCDTDIDWQARAAGGMVMVGHPSLVVPNERPNEFLMQKPELAEQAGRDGETFAAKWGGRPW
jgi:hypothetical protein